MVKFLNTLKATGMTSSQAYDSLPQYSLYRDKTDCPFDKYSTIYQQAKNKYSHARFDLTDGVKIYFSDNEWLLFRGSGNAPEFRVFAQSADPKTADKLGHEGLSLVKSVVNPHLSTHQYHSSSAQDSLSVLPSIDEFPDQCTQVINEIAQQHIPSECYLVDNIVVSGMGGSALGGRIINSLEREALRIPVIVSTEYHLPHFVNERTLVVISSYSGNTAETISSYYEARSRGAKIYVLASGGKLADLAAKDNLPGYIFNPKHNISSQPRMGLGYNILALITLLSRCQLIHPPTNLSELPKYLKSVQSSKPKLQQLASKLQGKIPVLISSEHLKGAAHAVKNEFNENSKTFCATFDLPELNHHLLEGLSFPKTNPTNLFFLFITSQYYHPEIQKSYPVTQAVINKNNIPLDVFALQGPSRFFEVFELVQSGAYLAYYLSQVNGVDPGPIPWVDWYKDEIRKVV
jgi:glucose/mannose-6-phosphate isomerase